MIAYLSADETQFGTARSSNLFQTIIHHRESKCREPRDKVYAMLAVAGSTPGMSRIGVDYTKSLHSLALEVIEYSGMAPNHIAYGVRNLADIFKVNMYTVASLLTL